MPPCALTGGACRVAGRKLHKAGQPTATNPEDLCGIVGAGGGGGQPVGTASWSRREAQPLGILTSTAVVLGEQGLSNIDIEKHLRRAELKVAQANAWLAMARELAWQRDDYGGRAAR